MTHIADQIETIAFLEAVLSRHDGEVHKIATHASLVFLGTHRALKLKRAVRFAFLDFSTPERRLRFCEAELALNMRTAPQLYMAVRRITRETDGRLALDGAGGLVDAVVEMRRFKDRDLFDSLAQHHELTPALMTRLARRIAHFHKLAETSRAHGGAAAIGRVLDMNEQGLNTASMFPTWQANELSAGFREALRRLGPLLDRRREEGKVRRCHGDLILRNICLFENEPTLFDCLEFNEDLATIDVLYDLAFLLMDLWHRNQRDLANLVFNRYLDELDETDGLALMPFFIAMRAAVRALVTSLQASEALPDHSAPLRDEAVAYFDLARSLIKPVAPILVAVGGLSGSGKSTATSSIAPALGSPPGARVLSSDRTRKALYGVVAESPLPAAAYRPEVSERVYTELRSRARATLAAGCAVVVDAVHDWPAERKAIEVVGRQAGVTFVGFWLTAPLKVLLSRLAERHGDPSDANATVLLAQASRDCGDVTWHRIDAESDPAGTRETMLAALAVCTPYPAQACQAGARQQR